MGAAKITIIIAILPWKSAINYLYNKLKTLSGFGEAIQYCQLSSAIIKNVTDPQY